MFLPLKGSLKIFFGHYSMIQISVLQSDNFVDAINFSVWEESEFLNHPTVLPTPHTFRRPCSGACSTFLLYARCCCCFHEQMVLNFGIKLCYMLTHLDSYPVLTYLLTYLVSVCELNRQTWPPSLLPLTVFFDFCLPLAFPFSLARSLPPLSLHYRE